MKISVISAEELDGGLISHWKELQKLDSTLNRPFYHPEFTRLVSAVRPQVRIAVIEKEATVCAILPFELSPQRNVCPVGLGLNDYHGLIANLSAKIPVHDLLRAIGARYWHFDHLPVAQSSLSPYLSSYSSSPVMDMTGGLEAFHQRLAEFQNVKKPGVLSSLRNAKNRVQRDYGPLRFEWDERSPVILEKLMSLKSNQWRRTVGPEHDAFAVPWIERLIKNGHALTDSDFCGTLSALYAGETLLAAHFGLRSNQVLHYSFPAYEPDLSKYMPGSLLLQQFAESSLASRITTIDLGRGTQDYKMRLATSTVALGEGAIANPQIFADAKMQFKMRGKQIKDKLKSFSWISKTYNTIKFNK